ncbi:MAG TPA: hypothetical protein DCM38_04575, partial [Gammaproteobacteria bacterium]|nr:hypothetical protein [Gammaproteobacteria bacterium]
MKKIITLLILTFANQTFALYDFAAINIIPNSDEVSFCLEYDTQKIDRAEKPSRADNLYLAAVSKPG